MDKIEIPEWWSPGNGMSYLRSALPFDHPEHPYNYIKNKLGLIPEEYGQYIPGATISIDVPIKTDKPVFGNELISLLNKLISDIETIKTYIKDDEKK